MTQEPPAVATPVPMTPETFAQRLEELVVEADAAGIGPLRLLARYLGKKGLGVVDAFFASIETGSVTRKK